MIAQYLTDKEYPVYFPKLNNLRQKIVKELPLKPGMNILDLATGYGYFALQISKLIRNLKITGIDISWNGVQKARKNMEENNLTDKLKILLMDATDVNFPSGSFDLAVNFLGLEDIHMTRGREGVQKTFQEVSRVLKPKKCFCFVVMPPEEMETNAQRLEVEIFSYICNATWLSFGEYESMLKDAKFSLIKRKRFYTSKKLTPKQAKEEIKFACENAPIIYGVNTPSVKEVWAKYGKDIEKNGLGHYSKVVLVTAQKINQVK